MTTDGLTAFLAARLSEAWSAGRDRELEAGLAESAETRAIDAMRAILERHGPCTAIGTWIGCQQCDGELAQEWPCPDVLSVAAIWSDHPDYRPEWRP